MAESRIQDEQCSYIITLRNIKFNVKKNILSPGLPSLEYITLARITTILWQKVIWDKMRFLPVTYMSDFVPCLLKSMNSYTNKVLKKVSHLTLPLNCKQALKRMVIDIGGQMAKYFASLDIFYVHCYDKVNIYLDDLSWSQQSISMIIKTTKVIENADPNAVEKYVLVSKDCLVVKIPQMPDECHDTLMTSDSDDDDDNIDSDDDDDNIDSDDDDNGDDDSDDDEENYDCNDNNNEDNNDDNNDNGDDENYDYNDDENYDTDDDDNKCNDDDENDDDDNNDTDDNNSDDKDNENYDDNNGDDDDDDNNDENDNDENDNDDNDNCDENFDCSDDNNNNDDDSNGDDENSDDDKNSDDDDDDENCDDDDDENSDYDEDSDYSGDDDNDD